MSNFQATTTIWICHPAKGSNSSGTDRAIFRDTDAVSEQ